MNCRQVTWHSKYIYTFTVYSSWKYCTWFSPVTGHVWHCGNPRSMWFPLLQVTCGNPRNTWFPLLQVTCGSPWNTWFPLLQVTCGIPRSTWFPLPQAYRSCAADLWTRGSLCYRSRVTILGTRRSLCYRSCVVNLGPCGSHCCRWRVAVLWIRGSQVTLGSRGSSSQKSRVKGISWEKVIHSAKIHEMYIVTVLDKKR